MSNTTNRYQRLCRYCASIKGAMLVGLPFPRKCERCECWKTDVCVTDTKVNMLGQTFCRTLGTESKTRAH